MASSECSLCYFEPTGLLPIVSRHAVRSTPGEIPKSLPNQNRANLSSFRPPHSFLFIPFPSFLSLHSFLFIPSPTLAQASYFHDSQPVRVLTAAIFSVYCLAESAATHSHRDYANMYICWLLALFREDTAAALGLGICIHYVASSGFGKCIIGGGRAWVEASTMRGVLREFSSYSLAETGPAFPALNRFVRRQPWLLTSISIFTLLFECVAVPAALVLPVGVRFHLVTAMVGLHVGIAVLQSFGANSS
jgi:hypothetical protein